MLAVSPTERYDWVRMTMKPLSVRRTSQVAALGAVASTLIILHEIARRCQPGTHPAGYVVAGLGNLGGNGTDDVLWFNSSNGQTDTWKHDPEKGWPNGTMSSGSRIKWFASHRVAKV